MTICLGHLAALTALKLIGCHVFFGGGGGNQLAITRTHWFKKDTASSLYCFIFEAKKFTAASFVTPLCSETSICKSIDTTSMLLIAARIFLLKQWFASGAHSCRPRKTGSTHCYLGFSTQTCKFERRGRKAVTRRWWIRDVEVMFNWLSPPPTEKKKNQSGSSL